MLERITSGRSETVVAEDEEFATAIIEVGEGVLCRFSL